MRVLRFTRAVADTLRMHAASLLMRGALRVFFGDGDAEEFEDAEDAPSEDRGESESAIFLFEAQEIAAGGHDAKGLKTPRT